MKRWGINAVRLPLMPDADSSPAFWSSVASHFAANHSLVFDLNNEPRDIGWDCWLTGCEVPAGGRFSERHPAYLATGMQQLVNAVRSVGATQPLMLGGVDDARDLSGWLGHEPVDPLGQLVASEHNYGHHLAPCLRTCKGAIEGRDRGDSRKRPGRRRRARPDRLPPRLHRQVDALGRPGRDLLHRLGLGHQGRLDMPRRPSLIENYRGRPTGFGIGFRDHLLKLRHHARG